MALNSTQDIFQLECLLKNVQIKICARIESGVKQLLAIVTSCGDLVLHYSYGELAPVVKRIPWFSDKTKGVQAVCFDPSATWLLVVCVDGSLYIIPALSLVDKRQKIDCKWSLGDVTHFPKHCNSPNVKPTSVVWWQTYDCNQNALVGFENGTIVVISLTDGRCLGNCSICEAVVQLQLCYCQENSLNIVSLLIDGISGQQWRLILEHSKGYSWPPDSSTPSDDSSRSRFSNLRQLGVEKLAFFKQRLTEARGSSRRDSQSSESSYSESNCSEPELLPHLCDTIFAPQYARNQYLFSAFYKPSSLLTIHAANVESAPLYVHKLPENCTFLLLTDRLIYGVNYEDSSVFVISTNLSECRLEGDSEFNDDALVAEFQLKNEQILQVYKLVDTSMVRAKKNREEDKRKKFELPKKVEDLTVQKPRIDTCVVVTNCAVYKINVGCSPIHKFIHYVTENNNLEVAEKLSNIFGLNLQQLFECCGDLLISRGSYYAGILLYNQAKVHLLKRVLKLAITADCKTLLKFVHLCLSASKVEMSMATKIHMGNLAVMAYTELILRFGGSARINNTKDFMNFLCKEEYYDQVLAVNVACQAGLWNILGLLARSRGLQPEVVSALGQILQSARAPSPQDSDFLVVLSEPSLTQALIILSGSSSIIFEYVRSNIQSFSLEILTRLVLQLDPSQPCVIPMISRFQSQNNKKIMSSFDSSLESLDEQGPDKTLSILQDLIETFLIVLLSFLNKSGKNEFQANLLGRIELQDKVFEGDELPLNKLPDLRPLSCGYEHTAIVRNNLVYSMGVSRAGCLGLGPLLSHSSPPKLVQTLNDLRVKAISVSCGRKHTLVITEFGLYSWGSNTYGQLGLGPDVYESPYPQLITSLAEETIVEIAAGQYHSVALSLKGRVYTWGWGVHGQLGHGQSANEFLPRLVKFTHPIRQVAAGHAHTLILTVKGQLFGFGSNAFEQLEECHMETTKTSCPVWVMLLPDIYTPIEKVATSYFHNVAVRADQEVFTWGSSPQEMRMFQSRNRTNETTWKKNVHVYSNQSQKVIEQVAAGYRHSAVLHQGVLLWGKNKEENLTTPNLRDQDTCNGLFEQKFLYVACGLDYTMAIHNSGKLLAWGSASMSQTILGKSLDDEHRLEGKVMVSKSTRRIIKFPASHQGVPDDSPIEVPGLPSMAITFNNLKQRIFTQRKFTPYSLHKIENSGVFNKTTNSTKTEPNFSHSTKYFNVNFTNKTLIYALQSYYGFYDSDVVLQKLLEVQNYQAASCISMLDGHFGDSLTFQLLGFKGFLEGLDVDLHTMFVNKDVLDGQEKDLNERNLKNSCGSPARILSSSSSLDSIRHWGDDEHQGGLESPCDIGSDGEIRQNITQYVQALQQEQSPPISSVSKILTSQNRTTHEKPFNIKDNTARQIIETASQIVEFYIKEIYQSENHILMQNILMKCIEFWVGNGLPVVVLESILLKNLEKYFYPLSILLFCKNFEPGEPCKDETSSSGFLKEFSTKFCLQLCSMVLENVNKS